MNERNLDEARGEIEEVRAHLQRLDAAVHQVIVGHDEVVTGALLALVSEGHVLIEGVPGLGKTLLVRCLASCLDLSFSRIQFTPDLMPADITGTQMIEETPSGRGFRFEPGPLFSHIVLADEINRATPKTQSALLEAMQERSVTAGGKTRPVPRPFMVLATENPIEMEGTYPLPEAQLDRFLFKLMVEMPEEDRMTEILQRTSSGALDLPRSVLSHEDLSRAMTWCSRIEAASHLVSFVSRLILGTHPQSPCATERIRKFVRYGSSPRGGQAMIWSGKVKALMEGRFNLAFSDLRSVLLPSLRHRLILNFEGLAEGISKEELLVELFEGILEKEAAWKG